MWKLVIGFVVIAGLALFLLNKGGDIDMGGEKHGLLESGTPVSQSQAAGGRLALIA